jgi:hypothetical protein
MENMMPLDMTALAGDFVPMNHREVQPIAAKALKCFDENGTEIPGYHHIVRGDTGATIHVAPDTYTVVQNEMAVDLIERALKSSKLDLTDARFGVDYSHDGARMFAQWILPAHTAVVRPGVEASLRTVLLNSYDGTSAVHGRTGAYNWVCANTSVAGTEYGSFRMAHKGQIDLGPAVARLTRAAEEHVAQVERWKAWPDIRISDATARAVIGSIPLATTSLIDGLVHAWLKARDEDPLQGGDNLWCLFNVLTAWASSKEANALGIANRAYRNNDRELKVAKVIEGKLWKEIAADVPGHRTPSIQVIMPDHAVV